MRDTVFFRQAELLLRILPLVHKEEAFALKGGTAINFFVQDLPRLSVDIDLTYLPLHERDFALDDIRKGLARIAEAIEGRMPGARILLKKIHGTDVVRGLIVERDGITVKVEANLVLRGSVYPAETKTLSKRAQDLFELSLQMRILSPHDLYAGKICAALDRQHPRDLFDVHLLFRTRGLDPQTRKAFLVYLVSHPRPMVEILDPQEKDIQELFEKEFKGMITEPVTWEDLAATREKLVSMMGEGLSAEERRFIVSVKEGTAGMGPARARRNREPARRQMETAQHSKDGQGQTSAGRSQAERLSGCVRQDTVHEKERPLAGAQTCNAIAGGVDDHLSYMIECSDTPTFIRAIANKCQLLPPHRAP